MDRAATAAEYTTVGELMGGPFAPPTGLNQTNFFRLLIWPQKTSTMFPKIKSGPKADIQDGRQNALQNSGFSLKCIKVAFKTQFIPIWVIGRGLWGIG